MCHEMMAIKAPYIYARAVTLSAGHGLYDIRDVQLIPLLQGGQKAASCDMGAERRYRRLITSGLDLSKNFVVSYSYNLCRTLQSNLTAPASDPFGSRFVWNEYLTRDFRKLVCSSPTTALQIACFCMLNL
jgi:hypothetical protein